MSLYILDWEDHTLGINFHAVYVIIGFNWLRFLVLIMYLMFL